jgi:hypothetical protein
MSVHEIGVLEVIRLSGLIGHTPKPTVIGVEPQSPLSLLVLTSSDVSPGEDLLSIISKQS